MDVSNNYSSCDNKSVKMKPVRVLLQDILRKSHIEVTTVDMVPETIVENCAIKSHMHTHRDEKPCSCSQGNESFEHSSQQSNNEHSETHKELGLGRTHNKETPFTCILCLTLYRSTDDSFLCRFTVDSPLYWCIVHSSS